jgi:hypothetical protein
VKYLIETALAGHKIVHVAQPRCDVQFGACLAAGEVALADLAQGLDQVLEQVGVEPCLAIKLDDAKALRPTRTLELLEIGDQRRGVDIAKLGCAATYQQLGKPRGLIALHIDGEQTAAELRILQFGEVAPLEKRAVSAADIMLAELVRLEQASSSGAMYSCTILLFRPRTASSTADEPAAGARRGHKADAGPPSS